MKLNKKNYIHLAVLIGGYLLMVVCITRFTYAYGSKLDWASQHFAIPDNIRRMFYESGDPFPDFILNLGAGENIYNFSYYGLYSPIILLSYLFPFVPMYIYIQVVSIIGVCVSIFLFYRWMNRKFTANTALALSVMFEFSTGFSVHSHRHIMFVSYMPFLLLAFGAVENYFKSRRKYALVIYTFLCIMCCYYFGVASVAAIAVYGVYEYLRTAENVTARDIWKKGFHFAGRIMTAVFMAGVLLLPTLYCLMNGRDAGNAKRDLTMLLPRVNMGFFCFDNYGMGLTVVSVIAVVSAVVSKNKKHTRFLGIVMLSFLLLPGTVMLLNGGLYADSKVLIPFMPLCLLLVGRLGEQVADKSFRWILAMPITAAFVALFSFFGASVELPQWGELVRMLVVADFWIVLAVCGIYRVIKKKKLLYVSAAVVAATAGIIANSADKLIALKDINYLFSDDMYSLADTVRQDGNLVRTANLISRSNTVNYVYNNDYLVSNVYSSLHNKRYNRFYYRQMHNENEFRNTALTAQSQSLLYQVYMGQKYLITNNKMTPSVMYKKVKESGELSLYRCDAAMPLGFSSSNLLNEQAYYEISYPQSLGALMNNIIVPEGGTRSAENGAIKPVAPFEIGEREGITAIKGGYAVRLEKTAKLQVRLPESVQPGEIVLVTMDIDNNFRRKLLPNRDAKIYINGIKNNLTDPSWKYYNNNTTFEFALSPKDDKPMDTLDIKLVRGNYNIKNIQCHVMTLEEPDVDEFMFDKEKTKGDSIVGSIDVTQDGYFKMSIPYTEGFTAYIDGEETEVECVDTAFIGFPIAKGHHDIKITFTAPLKGEGLLMSAGGIVILGILIGFEIYENKKKTKKEDV